MPRVAVVYLEAGGGHRAAAHALADAIRLQGRDWTLDLLNLDLELQSIDPLYRLTGIHGYELYNWTLRHGWTIGSAQQIRMLHAMVWALYPLQVQVWRKRWRELRPDLVLSVSPHFNRAMYSSLAVEQPGTPYVTLFTDLADYPPHFWVEDLEQHCICATDRAADQAASAKGGRIWRTSGMVIHPRFHESITKDRAQGRRELGLDPHLPTGLVLFGGYGSSRMMEIATRAAQSHSASRPVQMIFLCGRNRKLADRLRKLTLPYPVAIREFTNDVAGFMALSDFLIGKPGPGSISEALAMRLPVIVESNLRTLAQERYNVQWIRERGVGVVIPSFKSLAGALDQILDPGIRGEMLRRINRMQNRAVFEVPDILERILEERPDVLAGAGVSTRSMPRSG